MCRSVRWVLCPNLNVNGPRSVHEAIVLRKANGMRWPLDCSVTFERRFRLCRREQCYENSSHHPLVDCHTGSRASVDVECFQTDALPHRRPSRRDRGDDRQARAQMRSLWVGISWMENRSAPLEPHGEHITSTRLNAKPRSSSVTRDSLPYSLPFTNCCHCCRPKTIGQRVSGGLPIK